MNDATKIQPAQLFGTWRLVLTTAVDKNGQALPPLWGPEPMGRLVLTKSGRMMAVLCDGRTSLPAGQKRAYSSYCGNYRIENDILITKVDGASDASRIGGEQRRGLALRDNKLVLIPQTEANGEQRELYWQFDGPA